MNSKYVTVVTGGGRGIGRAIAVRMAAETAVLVVGRTESDLVSVCDEINNTGAASLTTSSAMWPSRKPHWRQWQRRRAAAGRFAIWLPMPVSPMVALSKR